LERERRVVEEMSCNRGCKQATGNKKKMQQKRSQEGRKEEGRSFVEEQKGNLRVDGCPDEGSAPRPVDNCILKTLWWWLPVFS
jgi:hypothetical protein